MTHIYSVALSKIIKELSLKTISMPGDPDKILVSSTDVNRPGLELNGFYDYYDEKRIMIFGNAETAFLKSVPHERRSKVLNEIFQNQKNRRRRSLRVTSSLFPSCWKQQRETVFPC